jgi:electron transfer flavoprotein alpha subunit
MKVLVFLEQRDGKYRSICKEALTIAKQLGASVAGVAVGAGLESHDELSKFGLQTIFKAEGDAAKQYNVLTYADAVADAAKSWGADCIIGGATPMGKDVLPRVAAKLGSAIASDVTAVQAQNGSVVATKPLFAGKLLGTIELSGDAPKVLSVRPNSVPVEEGAAGSVEVHSVELKPADARLKLVEMVKSDSEKADLTEASVIISGGRSLASEENFKILEDCAEVLGATVGASRAAVDAGYAPHSMQVGQTGKTVNPNLYIACGISGAIQHLAGMRTSKYIVAINKDENAPIFKIADYGIVADLFEVVPALQKKLQELTG